MLGIKSIKTHCFLTLDIQEASQDEQVDEIPAQIKGTAQNKIFPFRTHSFLKAKCKSDVQDQLLWPQESIALVIQSIFLLAHEIVLCNELTSAENNLKGLPII